MAETWTILEQPTNNLADGELLERYVACREPQAFAQLVRRHQARVLRVCRRLLGDEHVAEDVCQETFAVLARKAGELPWQASIGPWLSAVARRLALNARVRGRRHSHDDLEDDAACACPGPVVEASRRELQTIIGAEVGQLPDKYRAPVILCYLEGRTNVEAARLLGWPTGSMSRRLEHARGLLSARLSARGLGVWLVLAGMAAALAWFNSAAPSTQTNESPRLAQHCRPGYGPQVLAVLESLARERNPGLSRAALADLANGIAADASSLPTPELRQAARDLSEEVAKPEALPTIPASRVLLLCANCHADARR